MAWTKGQQDAIDARGESLLVSAAAGSGKTAVLVERITGLLKEGSDLSRMLIVTFTEAAAAEMKERIAASVGTAAIRHSHISTFHSFAMSIIRKYYHVTGVNPNLSICDEYKQTIFKNEAIDEMFEELFEDKDQDFIEFLNCYSSSKDSYGAKKIIIDFYAFLQSLPEPDTVAERIESGKAFDVNVYIGFAADYAKAALIRAKALLEAGKCYLTETGELAPMPKLAEKIAKDISYTDSVLASFEAGRFEEAFRLASEVSFQRMVASNAEKEAWNEVKDTVSALRNATKDEYAKANKLCSGLTEDRLLEEKQLLSKPLSQLVSLERNFAARYATKKKKAGLMDFSDIEHFALDILKNEEVCEELRASFDYIFVDEYQDSNVVQESLIARFSRDDNLFFVGDVKQSIYKFRLAEPELFLAKYEAYRNGSIPEARAIDLNNNFRSKSCVIDTVNTVFSGLMTKESTGIEYDEAAALVEGNPYKGELLYDSKLYLVASKSAEDEILDEAIEDLKGAELEAIQAAMLIKEYHGKPIYDSKKGIDRPLEYKDMVLLLPAVKTHGETFYQAFEDAGIPVFLERGQGYFDTPEIQVFLSLLRIIDNFKQDVPLISVLYFPAFGFSAEQLADIRIFASANGLSRRIPFSEAFKYYAQNGEGELKNKAEGFLQQIESFRLKAACEQLADFCWELLSESKIAQFAQALPAGAQRYANLRALVDKAEAYEAQSGGGLYGFISYIETISDSKKGVSTGQISMLGEGTDAVRIMTIHKSKGLEFPFVLLSGLGQKKPNNSSSNLDMDKDFGASMKLVDPKKGVHYIPISKQIIAAKKKKDEYAERVRVLYVAMTRAKDILLMTAAVDDPDKLMNGDLSVKKANVVNAVNSVGMILPFMPPGSVVPVSKTQLLKPNESLSSNVVLDQLENGFETDESKLPISRDALKERLLFDYSPSESSLKKRKFSVSALAEAERVIQNSVNECKTNASASSRNPVYASGSSRRIPVFAGGSVKLDAASKGTAYHKVMEQIPFTAEGKSAEEISAFIKQLRERNLISEQEADAIEPERIEAFFRSDIGKKTVAAEELHKEASFIMKTQLGDTEAYVQGTIDCYFREGQDYVLVDYKSNYINPDKLEEERERLKEHYVPQLKLYREALEKITGKKVSEAVLYLFGMNDAIKL